MSNCGSLDEKNDHGGKKKKTLESVCIVKLKPIVFAERWMYDVM